MLTPSRWLLLTALLLPAPALAQSSLYRECYQLAAWFPPSLLNCQRSGTTALGLPIWLCCD